MAQVINGIALNPAEGFDKITSTDKITKGYFTGDDGKLETSHIISGTLSATNENYYFAIAKDTVTGSVQFNVTYGSNSGYGSLTDSGNVKGQTEAIYKEWANILLPENEVTGGFIISNNSGLTSAPTNASVASGKDDNIFVMVASRTNMKDRLNKKNWTIAFSGSVSGGPGAVGQLGAKTGSQMLHLTDDSATVEPIATPAGPRYNIVSGSQGSVSGSGASDRTFGWFYPDQGVLVFSATELSASIPGSGSLVDTVTTYNNAVQAGFATTTNVDDNYRQALRFINALNPNGTYLQFRNEEDQTSVSYFCRARASHGNFSTNPTFVSGSLNEIRQKTMRGNPTVYITGVELYDSVGNMVATGKLSKPLKKNFSSEATIKVKLTF